MKNKYTDIFTPQEWTQMMDEPRVPVQQFAANIFNMTITSTGEKDDNLLNEGEDVVVEFELGENEVALIQHQTYEIEKGVDEAKKVFVDKDAVPHYEYELKVRNKNIGGTAIYKVTLDRLEAETEMPDGEIVKAKAELLPNGSIGITDITKEEQEIDPFDLPF